jgi:hypothetical protein
MSQRQAVQVLVDLRRGLLVRRYLLSGLDLDVCQRIFVVIEDAGASVVAAFVDSCDALLSRLYVCDVM